MCKAVGLPVASPVASVLASGAVVRRLARISSTPPKKSLPPPHPVSLRVPYRYLGRTEIIKWKFQSVLGGPNSREYPETSIAEGMIPVNKTGQTFYNGAANNSASRSPLRGDNAERNSPKSNGKIPQPAAEVKSAESIAGKICTWHIPFTNLWYNTPRFRQAEVRPRPKTGIRGNNNNDLPALMGLCSAHRSDPIRAGFIMQTDIEP